MHDRCTWKAAASPAVPTDQWTPPRWLAGPPARSTFAGLPAEGRTQGTRGRAHVPVYLCGSCTAGGNDLCDLFIYGVANDE
jgi:hypothetical protein